MRIPEKFTLGAVKWEVKIVDELPDKFGQCDSKTARILLEKNDKKSVMEQAFCHELLHALLYATGRPDHDEILVDGVAQFLHQYLTQIYK